MIYCFAISPKRYALFLRDEHGNPVLLQKGINNHEDRWSEHGLDLPQIEAGIIHSPESVYTEYPDPRREEWETKILPVLKKIPIAILKKFSGRSRSMLRRTIAGKSKPRRKNQDVLSSALRRLGLI